VLKCSSETIREYPVQADRRQNKSQRSKWRTVHNNKRRHRSASDDASGLLIRVLGTIEKRENALVGKALHSSHFSFTQSHN
jgi:hypothetical protein